MGTVIGKNSENLYKIEQKTGAALMVYGRNGLYVKGSPESQKRAIREIKEQAVSLAMTVIRKQLFISCRSAASLLMCNVNQRRIQ